MPHLPKPLSIPLLLTPEIARRRAESFLDMRIRMLAHAGKPIAEAYQVVGATGQRGADHIVNDIINRATA